MQSISVDQRTEFVPASFVGDVRAEDDILEPDAHARHAGVKYLYKVKCITRRLLVEYEDLRQMALINI